MNKRRQLAFWLAYFLLITVMDVVAIEVLVRPSNAWGMLWKWHNMLFVFEYLVPVFAASYGKKRTEIFMPLIVPVMTFFGLEDTLYYLLQLRLPPPVYTGAWVALVYEPSWWYVGWMNVLGLTFVYIVWRLANRRRT